MGGVDNETALAEGDAGEASGGDADFVAVEDVGSEVDVAAFKIFAAPGRVAGEGDGRLGDEVAGISDYVFAEGFDFFAAGPGSHEHAVAAGFVGGFDDEFGEVVEDEGAVGGLAGEIGLDVGKDGVFAEVVFDDLGDEVVDDFVVGDSGADGVCQSHVAGAAGVDEAGDAEEGVGTEHGRIKEIVVDAAVDDVDGHEAGGGAHVDLGVAHDEVASFDNRDAHLAGEEGVFKVGGVVDAGGEEDHVGAVVGAEVVGRDELENVAELVGVIVDRVDVGGLVEIGERTLEGGAVFQHVGGAGRTAKVVFKDEVAAVATADEVGAADVDVDVFGDVASHELATEMLGAVDVVRGDDAVLEDFLFVVEIVEEEVEGGDALDEAFFDNRPFIGGNDAGHEVEGEDAFGAFVVVVDGEGDAAAHEREVDSGLTAMVFLGVEALHAIKDTLVMWSHQAAIVEHFVEKIFG